MLPQSRSGVTYCCLLVFPIAIFQRNLTIFTLLLAVASAHPRLSHVEHGQRKMHWYYSGMVSPIGSAGPYQNGNTTAHATGSSLYTTVTDTTVTVLETTTESVSPAGDTSSSVAAANGGFSCSQATMTVTTYATITVTKNPSSSTYEQPPSSSSGPPTQTSESLLSHATTSTDTMTSTSSPQTISTKEKRPHSSPPKHPKPQGGSKRGFICDPEQVPQMATYPKNTWDMNWWEGPPSHQPNRWMFLPMLTHLEPDQYWQSTIAGTKPNESPYIAGFLEPDINNYDIDASVKSWKANIELHSQKFTLIPPVIGQNGLS